MESLPCDYYWADNIIRKGSAFSGTIGAFSTEKAVVQFPVFRRRILQIWN